MTRSATRPICSRRSASSPTSTSQTATRAKAFYLRGEPFDGRETIFSAYSRGQRMVRDRRHKLIEYCVEGVRTTQLFDLDADPLEMRNLADDPAERGALARLRDELRTWRARVDDPVVW